MKIFKFFLIFHFAYFSLSVSASDAVSDKEMKSFLEAIKEKKDEELLIASKQFTECEPQFKNFREDKFAKI